MLRAFEDYLNAVTFLCHDIIICEL
jgi:hypothetical protein